MNEFPDRWVLLKLPDNQYKVFGSWAGGYLDGDRWKLNSGIQSVTQDEEYYYFNGFSGSCYQCHKLGYGVATSYSIGVLDDIVERAKGQIEVLDTIEQFPMLEEA
jgi:hypothetical protein